jgi:hypothetical protein
MNFGKDAVNGWLKEWRASCNNSSTLALFDASGTPHLLWTTGSNGQFLMCAPIDIAGTVRDPSSALNASQPAFDSNSMTASKCFKHQCMGYRNLFMGCSVFNGCIVAIEPCTLMGLKVRLLLPLECARCQIRFPMGFDSSHFFHL